MATYLYFIWDWCFGSNKSQIKTSLSSPPLNLSHTLTSVLARAGSLHIVYSYLNFEHLAWSKCVTFYRNYVKFLHHLSSCRLPTRHDVRHRNSLEVLEEKREKARCKRGGSWICNKFIFGCWYCCRSCARRQAPNPAQILTAIFVCFFRAPFSFRRGRCLRGIWSQRSWNLATFWKTTCLIVSRLLIKRNLKIR